MKFCLSILGLLTIVCFFFAPWGAYGQAATQWTGAAGTSNWNTDNNWTKNAPKKNSNVVVNSCTVCPVLAADAEVKSLVINAGRLTLGSRTLTAKGDITVVSATVESTGGRMTGDWLRLESSTFAGDVILTHTATVARTMNGGNTFRGNVQVFNTGNAVLSLAAGRGDVYEQNVTFSNASTLAQGGIRIAGNNSTGNECRGKATFVNAGSGFLAVGAGTGSKMVFHEAEFNQAASLPLTVGAGAGAEVEFTGPVGLNNRRIAATPAGNHRILVAPAGNCRFNGPVQVSNTSQGNLSGVSLGNAAGGKVTLANTAELQLGAGGFGYGELSLQNLVHQNADVLTTLDLSDGPAGRLKIGPAVIFSGAVGFTSPQLLLDGAVYEKGGAFTKTGATDNNCAGGNLFKGDKTTIANTSATGKLVLAAGTAPDQFASAETTFENRGKAALQVADRAAGNGFRGKTVFRKTDGTLTVAGQAGATAQCTGDVYFEGTVPGNYFAPGDGTITYQGNLWLGTGLSLGRAAGKTMLSGDAADQTIGAVDNASLPVTPAFSNLEINKGAGKKVLATIPFSVQNNLSLTLGILELDATTKSVVEFGAQASVSGGSNESYIRGTAARRGSTPFMFPLGDLGKYRPIATGTATTPGEWVVKATYFPRRQPLADKTTRQLSINDCEYWSLQSSLGGQVPVGLPVANSCTPKAANSTVIARLDNGRWVPVPAAKTGSLLRSTAEVPLTADGEGFFTLGYWNQLTLNTSRMNPATFDLTGTRSGVALRDLASGTPGSIVTLFPALPAGAADELLLQVKAGPQHGALTLAIPLTETLLNDQAPVLLASGTDRKPLKANYVAVTPADPYEGVVLRLYKQASDKEPGSKLTFRTNLTGGIALPGDGTLRIEQLPNLAATLRVYGPGKVLLVTQDKAPDASFIHWVPAAPLAGGVYRFQLTLTDANQSVKTYEGQFIKN